MASPQQKNHAMKSCTRVLFLLLLLLGLAEVFISVYLLFTCRSNAQIFKDVINIPTHTCSKLVYPTYFGCVIVASTICGFGCVGRRATALLVAIIAIVELGLAIPLWVDNPCSPLQEDDVLHSLNASLTDCYNVKTNSGAPHEKPITVCVAMKNILKSMCNVNPGDFEVLVDSLNQSSIKNSTANMTENMAVVTSLERMIPNINDSLPKTNISMIHQCTVCITDTLQQVCSDNASIMLSIFVAAPFMYFIISIILASIHHVQKQMLQLEEQNSKTVSEELHEEENHHSCRHHQIWASKMRGLKKIGHCLNVLSGSLKKDPRKRQPSHDHCYLMKTIPDAQNDKISECEDETKLSMLDEEIT